MRRWINEHRRLTGAIGGSLFILALCCALPQLFGGRGHRQSARSDQSFFSDDDGQTYFHDSAAKLPPFDHNGKTAYGAVVLRCAQGKPFIAFLRRYQPQDIPQVERQMKQSGVSNPASIDLSVQVDVKKPKESRWVTFKSDPKEYLRVTTPACPDGSDAFTSVTPDDRDSGATN